MDANPRWMNSEPDPVAAATPVERGAVQAPRRSRAMIEIRSCRLVSATRLLRDLTPIATARSRARGADCSDQSAPRVLRCRLGRRAPGWPRAAAGAARLLLTGC